MRLAEDRILSFVSVFSTGLGTKWITASTFYYTPEIKFQSLLAQRRRWINGTVASYLFFFLSKRAKDRVKGGFFDDYKSSKNNRFVNLLWALQLVQMLLVMVAPAVFAAASSIGLFYCAEYAPELFSWTNHTFNLNFTTKDIWLIVFVMVYVLWTFMSYFAHGGKMNEQLCWVMAFLGFIFVLPIYTSLILSISTTGFDLIHGVVVASILAPILVATLESITCAVLYVCYLPWFLVLLVFFLVYMPQYSFARAFDTTWGNRQTGEDAELKEAQLLTMKNWTFYFMLCLMALNITLSFVVGTYLRGSVNVLTYMFILFIPTIISLLGAVIFFVFVVPFRPCFAARELGREDPLKAEVKRSSFYAMEY